MPTRRGATTVTARRGPHFVGGSGAAVTGGGVSGLVQPRPLPPRSSHTKFVRERGLLRRRDLYQRFSISFRYLLVKKSYKYSSHIVSPVVFRRVPACYLEKAYDMDGHLVIKATISQRKEIVYIVELGERCTFFPAA